MAKVIWTEPALEDLSSVVHHIARDSPTYAARLGTSIVQAPRRLEDFPLSGRIVPEFSDENIRELIVGSYRLVYTVRPEACYVVAIIHGSRDIPRHLTPEDWENE